MWYCKLQMHEVTAETTRQAVAPAKLSLSMQAGETE